MRFSRVLFAVMMMVGSSCATLKASASTNDLRSLAVQEASGATSVDALLARNDATVFVFWSAHCPCVLRYQQRLEALAHAWHEHVGFVAVSSNSDETFDSVNAAARARGMTLPIVRDPSGSVAKAFGAKSTPTVVLVRRDGTVLYRGWVDNERLPGEVNREPWLEQALTGFVKGSAFAQKSPTWGCVITRSLASQPDCHSDPENPRGGSL